MVVLTEKPTIIAVIGVVLERVQPAVQLELRLVVQDLVAHAALLELVNRRDLGRVDYRGARRHQHHRVLLFIINPGGKAEQLLLRGLLLLARRSTTIIICCILCCDWSSGCTCARRVQVANGRCISVGHSIYS